MNILFFIVTAFFIAVVLGLVMEPKCPHCETRDISIHRGINNARCNLCGSIIKFESKQWKFPGELEWRDF